MAGELRHVRAALGPGGNEVSRADLEGLADVVDAAADYLALDGVGREATSIDRKMPKGLSMSIALAYMNLKAKVELAR